MKFIKEFKEFAVKGNVIDMAVGVIVGGAFGKIVSSLVNDIVMPAISLLTGKVNVAQLAYVAGTKVDGTEISLNYGMFLQNIIDFLIIALCVFIAVKFLAKLQKPKTAEPVKEPVPSNEEKLLSEIRDILKGKE
ncbi:MAG: large-conductance mechanosensitive channel protein MscL [Monoglobales bacterium]